MTSIAVPSAAGPTEDKVHDVVIIGAGIAGVFILAEGVRQGFEKVVVLEKKDRIGGLWTTLPDWQTVQNDTRDFCVQGFTTKRKTWYTKDVLHMLDEYVRVQKLRQYIELSTEVVAHDWSDEDGTWTVKTRVVGGKEGGLVGEERVYRSKKLVLCTGKHATPNLPAIPKDDGSVPILHSSQVQQWAPYKGKRVVVVGAGASSLDLLINSLQVSEKEVQGQTYWVLREPKYFGGFAYADLVLITICQLAFGLAAQPFISFVMNLLFHLRFWWMGLTHWLPTHPFDLQHEQFIPNRSYLLENAYRVDRRAGVEVVQVKGRQVKLSDGSTIDDVDAILMGTGYKKPKHVPNFDVSDFGFYMKSAAVGKFYGKLFLFGETLLDSTASTPISVHVLSRYFWYNVTRDEWDAVKMEKLRLDMDMNINHMDFLNHVSCMERGLYPTGIWRFRMLAVHLYYRFRYNTRVCYADRVLGYHMSLDE